MRPFSAAILLVVCGSDDPQFQRQAVFNNGTVTLYWSLLDNSNAVRMKLIYSGAASWLGVGFTETYSAAVADAVIGVKGSGVGTYTLQNGDWSTAESIDGLAARGPEAQVDEVGGSTILYFTRQLAPQDPALLKLSDAASLRCAVILTERFSILAHDCMIFIPPNAQQSDTACYQLHSNSSNTSCMSQLSAE
eukprot:19560-Heterococcus_DN1.PRE.1